MEDVENGFILSEKINREIDREVVDVKVKCVYRWELDHGNLTCDSQLGTIFHHSQARQNMRTDQVQLDRSWWMD